VMCPECTESWEVEVEGKMVQCPSCGGIWLRPQ
jgi:Zn-finger nucleic acid-binding protein